MNYLITFSPTGGTRKAAEQLCLGIDDRFNLIELCVPSQEVRTPELSENDMVVVAAPVYGGRIPALAAERITSVNYPETEDFWVSLTH